MYNIDELFNELDQIENLKVLKRMRKEIKESNLTEIFWEQRNVAKKSKKKINRQRAKLKCQIIAQKFGASIPISKSVRKFRAPYGFYGIQIGKYVQIGKKCTIFPHAVIGANTFMDSKNAGFPTIGDHVFIGAGAMIIGNVTIGDNARIGANAIVTKDVPANSVVVAAEPRIIIKDAQMDNEFISAKKCKKLLAAKAINVVDEVDDDDDDDIDDVEVNMDDDFDDVADEVDEADETSAVTEK